MPLTRSDKHHWAPVEPVQRRLQKQFGAGSVLDVGPGHAPLAWATQAVDFVPVEGLDRLVTCDLANAPLPFADKSFDFVYARHVLEDMVNPFPLLLEMQRVGKAGYIECPSPICELTRGVDGNAPNWRGYYHHRFLVWVAKGQLRFVSKYPFIEYLRDDAMREANLRRGPRYWNSYYLWRDTIAWKHRQHPLDFEILRDYGPMLAEACTHSMDATDLFFAHEGIDEEPETVPALGRAFG